MNFKLVVGYRPCRLERSHSWARSWLTSRFNEKVTGISIDSKLVENTVDRTLKFRAPTEQTMGSTDSAFFHCDFDHYTLPGTTSDTILKDAYACGHPRMKPETLHSIGFRWAADVATTPCVSEARLPSMTREPQFFDGDPVGRGAAGFTKM